MFNNGSKIHCGTLMVGVRIGSEWTYLNYLKYASNCENCGHKKILNKAAGWSFIAYYMGK